MGRTVIIAQARMSSTRLPGKVLADLGGKPVIDRVLSRAARSSLADDLLVATTTDPSDDVLVEHLDSSSVAYVRGSLDDVLSRYVWSAEKTDADTVVRITCDCPLIDPEVIDAVVVAFAESPSVDYCSNTLVRTYPLGMDCEVFSREALVRAHAEATQPNEREHVTPYIYQHPGEFRLRNVEAPEWARRPELRLTIDEEPDLALARVLVERCGAEADLRALLGAIDADPVLATLNAGVEHRRFEKPG